MLKYKCFNENFGILAFKNGDFILCGNDNCPGTNICGKSIGTKFEELDSFDTFFFSFFQVMQIITFDDWTSKMYKFQKVFTNFIWIYFVLIAIIGNLFLLNLSLAIIKVKFGESMSFYGNNSLIKVL